MIIHEVAGRTLADAEALAAQTRRPITTIRTHCQRIAIDTDTGRQLYDADAAIATLATIPTRRRVKHP